MSGAELVVVREGTATTSRKGTPPSTKDCGGLQAFVCPYRHARPSGSGAVQAPRSAQPIASCLQLLQTDSPYNPLPVLGAIYSSCFLSPQRQPPVKW